MLTTDFLRAGRASFLIANPSGERLTIYVKARKDRKVYYVSVRHANDPWQFAGMLNESNVIVRTPKARIDDRTLKIANWAIGLIVAQATPPAGYRLEHTGRCGRCNRLLTDAESLRTGLGPDCAGRR